MILSSHKHVVAAVRRICAIRKVEIEI